MRGTPGLSEQTASDQDFGAASAQLDGLTDLERFWVQKSDEALEDAAHDLASYLEEGQRVIRAELQRRSIPVPAPESEAEEDASGEPGWSMERGVRVSSSPVLANIAILKAALESHGIACEIRGEHLGGAAGELPPGETWPELVGPRKCEPGDDGYSEEVLPVAPSKWYLTGFLVPYEAPADQRSDDDSDDALDQVDRPVEGDDDNAPAAAPTMRTASSVHHLGGLRAGGASRCSEAEAHSSAAAKS